MKRPKLAILINIIAPYRIPVYTELAKTFDLTVMPTGRESNRGTWDSLSLGEFGINVLRPWGFTLRIPRFSRGKLFDYRYLHINPGIFWALMRLRPDAAISIEMGFRSLATLLYCRLFRIPGTIWWGGTLHTEATVGRGKRLLRKLFARITPKWISYGQTSTEYLQTLGIPGARVVQIQNCVDITLFQQNQERSLDITPKPVLLHVGQLINRKGIDQFLKAAALVQDHGRDFSIVLVGDGPQREPLQSLAEELGLKNVHWIKGVKPSEMPAIYKSADCVVFPTLEDIWGLVANEAIASGVPVLVSKYAGCYPELADPGSVFDPLNLDDFEAALTAFLDGRCPPPDLSKLRSVESVAHQIRDDILGRLRK